MKKYQGYAQNEKFKVGLNGKTVYIFDNDENELARFQDAPHMYRGKFIPNTNTLVVKSTAGWLLFYDLDSLALIKKIRFSNIGSQDGNFAITQDGKYLLRYKSRPGAPSLRRVPQRRLFCLSRPCTRRAGLCFRFYIRITVKHYGFTASLLQRRRPA